MGSFPEDADALPCLVSVMFDAQVWRKSGGGKTGFVGVGLPAVVYGVLRQLHAEARRVATRLSLSDALGPSLPTPRVSPQSNVPQVYCAIRLGSRVFAGFVRRGFCSCRCLAVPHADHRESHDDLAGEGRCAQDPFRQDGRRPSLSSGGGADWRRTCTSNGFLRRALGKLEQAAARRRSPSRVWLVAFPGSVPARRCVPSSAGEWYQGPCVVPDGLEHAGRSNGHLESLEVRVLWRKW